MATARLTTTAELLGGGSGIPRAGTAGDVLGALGRGARAEEEEARGEGEGGRGRGGEQVRGRGEQLGNEAGVQREEREQERDVRGGETERAAVEVEGLQRGEGVGGGGGRVAEA